MNYLSEMLKLPVLDVDGEKLGVVNDFGIATGEVFPHVTSLAFRGPGKTPFMISWRKWVDRIDETGVHLKTSATEIRFSYLQPTELLLARDVLNKQIVDTQGMKVVRVNDIKFSMSGENQLRLLGAEVGARGLLRAISPALEHIVEGFMKHLGKPLGEDIIAWSYMDLLDRSTKNIQLSVSHKTLGELHPADIADIIEQLDPRLRAQVFAQLDTAQAAEAISEFDDDELMTEMLEGLSDTDASSMLAMMDPDDAADLIDELDYEKAEKLLRLMGVKEEKAIRNLLGYEDNTAGRIMTSEFVSLPATATVGDAIEAIRELDEDFESVYYVYTEDPSGMLTGVLSLRTLIVADRDATLGQLAYRDLVYVSPDEDQEDVTDEMTKYDLVAIPVCDENRHILGIVTFDDAMDVMEAEATEDIEKMAAMLPTDKPYLKTSVFETFKSRIPWLLLLMVSATFTGQIIAKFEDALGACAILTAYIPMLMDTGGNAGSQASVTVIRGLSLNEIEYRDVPKVVFKEIRVALICGITLSAANFVKLLLLDKVGVLVAASVCLTLVAAVVIAMIIGCLLPILAKRLGFDPAVMASPFITTIVDAMSLLVYFRVASAILGL